MEEIHFKGGKWFLPGQPDKTVFGSLEYAPKGVTRLEVYDQLFEPRNKFESPDIILGYADGKKITLYKCYQTSRGAQEVYGASYIFIGHHFESVSDLTFQKVSVNSSNLTQWLDLHDFNAVPQSENGTQYGTTFKLPADIPLFDEVGYSSKLSFGSNQRYDDDVRCFTQYALFQLTRTAGEESFEWFMDETFSFLKLLTLFSFSPAVPKSIRLTKGDNVIDVLYNSPVQPASKSLDNAYFIIPFELVKGRLDQILKFWADNREDLNPIVNLLVDGIYYQENFDENRFLNIAQAIETFHRNFRKNTPPPDKAKMFAEIIEDSRDENKAWLRDKLGQWNQPSLHGRLTDIVTEFHEGIFETLIPNIGEIVLKIKRSRQYYTHYLSDYKKNALKHAELFYLTRTLQFLLLTALLSEIGIPKEQLLKSLERLKYRYFYGAFKN